MNYEELRCKNHEICVMSREAKQIGFVQDVSVGCFRSFFYVDLRTIDRSSKIHLPLIA